MCAQKTTIRKSPASPANKKIGAGEHILSTGSQPSGQRSYEIRVRLKYPVPLYVDKKSWCASVELSRQYVADTPTGTVEVVVLTVVSGTVVVVVGSSVVVVLEVVVVELVLVVELVVVVLVVLVVVGGAWLGLL